jgi:hypothetical protein
MNADSRPSLISSRDAQKISAEVESRLRGDYNPNFGIQTTSHQGNGNGKAALYQIILAVAGGLAIIVLGIFGWVAIHVIEQQDDQSRRLATVEAKLDILLSNKNGKP